MATSRSWKRRLATAGAILLTALGGAGHVAAQRASGGAGGGSTFCPAVADVSRAMNFAVRVLPEGTRSFGEAHICAYQGTGPSANAFISISVQPLDPREDPVAEVRSAAKTFLGAQAEAEPIAVGDGGYAYGADSKSEAAARKGNRVFHVEVGGMERAKFKDKKAAVIELLKQVVR